MWQIAGMSKKDIPLILDLLYDPGRPKPNKDSQLDDDSENEKSNSSA